MAAAFAATQRNEGFMIRSTGCPSTLFTGKHTS